LEGAFRAFLWQGTGYYNGGTATFVIVSLTLLLLGSGVFSIFAIRKNRKGGEDKNFLSKI